jgi:hypothetical protein
MGKKFSNEILKKIEKEILSRVMEKEKKYRDDEQLSYSKEITVDSLSDISSLPREEIEKITKEVYEKYGYINLDELIEINKQIAQLEKTRNLIVAIAQKVPGFQSYVESPDIHDADKIIRDFMYARLIDFKKMIIVIMNHAQKRGKSEILPELDSLNLIMERAAKKCRYADYSSTESRSGNKLDVNVQYRILDYDWNLIAELDGIETNLESLKSLESKNMTKIISSIKKKVDAFENSFEKRKSVIREAL